MPIRRRAATPPTSTPDPLLSDLLIAPTADVPVRPVALRSLDRQRRTVLAAYPLRTWVDRVLTRAERVLAAIVLAVFGWWLIDGYGRDWYYARYIAPTRAATIPSPLATIPTPEIPLAHPELGASLPVVEDRWIRPSVQVDYLAPAQDFVAPLLPAPTAVPAAASPPSPADRRPLRLSIPAIELDSHVVEVFVQDGAWQVADYAVGYHHGTGVAGFSNMVLAGHKGSRGAVFRRLEQIVPGTEIFVDTDGQRSLYRVRSTGSVWPNQVDVMYPTEHAQLTLLTCTNWDTQRFIVIADFISATPSPASAGGSSSIGGLE
jgi:sortase A